jgi:glycyl-tRNA synthetase beta subunit
MYKKDMYKTEIKNVLNKNEMSMYEVGQFLRYISDFLKDTEFSPVKSANEAIGDAERVVNTIKGMIAKLIVLQDEIESAENALVERLNRTYENVTRKQHEIKKKLEELKPLSIRIPCNMKDLFEIVNRFQHLDEKAWQKVVDLAGALKL